MKTQREKDIDACNRLEDTLKESGYENYVRPFIFHAGGYRPTIEECSNEICESIERLRRGELEQILDLEAL